MAATAPAIDQPLLDRVHNSKGIRLTSRARLILERVAGKADEPVLWPPTIRAELEECTPKQRHFAVCVASGMSNTAAYKRAYDVAEESKESSLWGSASIIAAHPQVLTTVNLLLSWLDRAWLLDNQEVIEYGYGRLYEEAEFAPDSGDRIRAATNLLKAHGAFVSRSEVRHVHEVDVSALGELLSSIGDLVGLAVPITPPTRQLADVASVEFSEPDTRVP